MPASNIAIFTTSKDSHASAVDHALRKMGGRPILFNTSDMSQGEYLSVQYGDDDVQIRLGDYCGALSQITASWNRRISAIPNIPKECHPADQRYIRDNCRSTMTGVLQLLDDRFPVNPIAAARIASNKIAQIRAASRAGFVIPKTLVSNKLEDIRDFLGHVENACFKGYHTHGWWTDDGSRRTMTTRIDLTHLDDARSVELMPHIYQEYIDKKSEYRLTIFGQYASVVRIASDQLQGMAAVDWRSSPIYLNHLSYSELSDAVVDAAKSVLKQLGLRFGTFDISETKDGQFVFFEVNEAGQWIWKELHCPECLLVQPFCEYLLSADDNFTWSRSKARLEFGADQICKEVEADLEGRYKALQASEYLDKQATATDERSLQPVAL